MGQVFYYRKSVPSEEVVVSQYGGCFEREGETSNDIPSDTVDENTSLISNKKQKQNPQTRFITRLFFLSSILLWCSLLGGSAIYFFGSGKKLDMSQWHLLPQLLGWGSAILYCASRIPQIMQNFRNESVEGLSLVMFIFSVVGNLTYCVVSHLCVGVYVSIYILILSIVEYCIRIN
jgi:uncharacterized protein with PQ loop repeat